ncbi:hypothetical protein Tco_0164769 [Tanacetum coccineum]
MAESSSHNPSSPEITPKEEPVTLDKPKSSNPSLHANQVEFSFKEIALTTNNEVALQYPSHPNSEYFKVVSDFIFKCCLKEAFIRTPTQYKEYLCGIRGDIGITTFKNALRSHYLPHSSMYVSPPSITEVRPWFVTIGYNREIWAKGTIKNSFLPPRLAKDKSPSHPSPSTPEVGEMHKEAQQAAGGLTSLGATSEEGAHPQLSSGSDVSANSTPEADLGIFASNESIP